MTAEDDAEDPTGEWRALARKESVTQTHDHSRQSPSDECYWVDGCQLLRGRCDTCGKPCDDASGDCTADPTHETALEA